MGYSIEFGPEGAPDMRIPDSKIYEIDIARPHTAKADFDATVPYDKSLRNHGLSRCRVYGDGQLVFRGYLKEIDWNQKEATCRLHGPGIADDLDDSGIEEPFTRTPVHEAIRTIWNQYTDFAATVYDPVTTRTVTDAVLQDAIGTHPWAEVVTLADTDPIVIADVDGDGQNEFALAQSCYFKEGEDYTSGFSEGVQSESAASNGEFVTLYAGSDLYDYDYKMNLEYTLPGDNWGWAVRFRANDTASESCAGFSVIVDGRSQSAFSAEWGTNTAHDTWSWFTSGGDSQDVSGDVTVTIDEKSNNADADTYIDAIVLYDTRFTYTWPDSVDSNGYLEGPQEYPDAFTKYFNQERTTFNVVGAGLNTTWNNSGATSVQEVAVSVDGGQTWTTATEDIDTDYPDNAGTTVDSRVTLGRYGSGRTTQTPTTGFKRQYLTGWTLDYDGNNLAIIDQETYRGSPLKVLKELHRQADYRLVIDHAARDVDGNLTKVAESFERGTQTRSADWTVLNRKPKDSWTDYANHITIWGELKDDGTRPKVTVKDQSEIDQYGREPFSDIRPNLSTLDAVKSDARAELKKRIGNRERTGTLDVQPVNVLPGYTYAVDWFDDGVTTETALNRVSWSESAGRASGSLEFDRDSGVAGTIVDQGYQVRSLSEVV